MERVSRRKSKLSPIARKRHNYIYLILAILFGVATAYLFINYPPEYSFQLSNIGIPTLPIFLFCFIAAIFTALTFVFIQKTQGLIVSSLVLVFLLMRLAGLTHWIFALLLLALFIVLEFIVYKQK